MIKDKKSNSLADSVDNDVAEVKIGDLTYQTNSADAVERVEGEKSIQALEKALEEGVFSDSKHNESKDK